MNVSFFMCLVGWRVGVVFFVKGFCKRGSLPVLMRNLLNKDEPTTVVRSKLKKIIDHVKSVESERGCILVWSESYWMKYSVLKRQILSLFTEVSHKGSEDTQIRFLVKVEATKGCPLVSLKDNKIKGMKIVWDRV